MPLPPGPSDPRDTPAMRQYRRFKEQYPNCVLFFRIGDFYEMFDDDALLAHRVLGVTLTQRTEGIPMAGVPYHSVETYLRRMLQAGYRVAICDQVEDPALAKGIVERQVTRLVTPGTLTDEALLDEARPNHLLALFWHDFTSSAPARSAPFTVPLAWVELSTGAFHVADFPASVLADELVRIAPREILYPHDDPHAPAPSPIAQLAANLACSLTPRPSWQFYLDEARQVLSRQFQVATLAGFGLSDDDPCLAPAGAVLHYLLETQRSPTGQSLSRIDHLQPPRRFERSRHLIVDQVSLRSLEIERTLRSGSTEGSLLGLLSDCRTPMGKRLLRQWLCFPLCDRPAIEARQHIVEALVHDTTLLTQLRESLDPVQDIERILGRLGVNHAGPRDILALGQSAAQTHKLLALLQDRPALTDCHQRLAAVASPLTELARHIHGACVDHPPAHLREGGVFRDGFDAQLDEYRSLQRDSHHWLANYQKQLIEQTGIPSLKVGFNKVFGFYIELTAANRDRAPASWTRKQTLKNAERFITPPLKDYEQKVLSAESRAIAREQELFDQLCQFCRRYIEPLRQLAHVAAELDVLACFARRALRKRYVKPILVDQPVLIIRAGRHPVLDEILGDQFVPNDLTLGPAPDPADLPSTSSAPTLALITGPNMAGKSTFIRQAALITLLAHTGSFVPADQAIIGLTDRIFTRVGASDELHAGASTFMVEMTEAANICHHATDRSIVILDEIGRGTSTLDGLALAWAIGEYLAQRRCRTLFATHYHEITALAESFPNVVNLHVTVREWADQIVFLRRVQSGATDRSYGIHVAKLAGLPQPIVQRASQLLNQLEVNHRPAPSRHSAPSPQLPLFREYLEHPALDMLRQVNLDQLTPLQAFDLLRQLIQTFDQS